MQFTLLTAISRLNAQDCSVFSPPPSPTAPVGGAAGGNAASSCIDFFLSDPDQGIIEASCDADDQSGRCPSAFIGACVGVAQPSGNLKCQIEGGAGFNGTCTFSDRLQISGIHIILTATCGNTQGGLTTSSIDLNDCFANIDGVLTC
ncbi:hypothetical protein MVEN_00143000 [Mycena venus]|uniref:Cyanovirin-N domain-containing protein n=1 Tax=Mycena venus TaxID=2733690 RepID=A0A8H7DBD7_9AGAR|nr:hypothetical protein MVEN_00143000 [Mycena venus]